jgi:hypothetical protein
MAIQLLMSCAHDQWDTTGKVADWKLLSREGGNACGFVAVFDNTKENWNIINSEYHKSELLSDTLIFAVLLSIIVIYLTSRK